MRCNIFEVILSSTIWHLWGCKCRGIGISRIVGAVADTIEKCLWLRERNLKDYVRYVWNIRWIGIDLRIIVIGNIVLLLFKLFEVYVWCESKLQRTVVN